MSIDIDIAVPAMETDVVVRQRVTPTKLRLHEMRIRFGDGGTATVQAAWDWVDSENRVLKSGMTRKTEEQLIAAGLDVASLKALFAQVAKADAESGAQEDSPA